jgi:hypothetical protein
MVIVDFEGIDDFNRPVFKEIKSKNRYGSVDILFPYWESKESVLKKISEKDLCFFGTTFGCEPMGTKTKDIKIRK